MSEISNADIPEVHVDRIRLCEERIGYRFGNPQILLRGLTHSSSAATRLDSNERMEFLGDAVLGMVICEYLYERLPDQREGQLTQQKSFLVSRAVCADVGERLQLEELILVGKGLQDIPNSLKAAVIESIIAAIYIDGGYDAARTFILTAFARQLENCGELETDNYKSLLQEETQRDGSSTPVYVVLDQRGPDHAREFNVAVKIGERQFDSAWGKAKKEAEQKAAMLALEAIHEGPADTSNDGYANDGRSNNDGLDEDSSEEERSA